MSWHQSLRRALWSIAIASGGLTLVGTLVAAAVLLARRPTAAWQLFLVLCAVVALSAAAGVLVSGWLANRLATVFASRLSTLRDFARRLGKGEWTAELAISTTDELDELAYALRQMAADLQSAARQRDTFLAAVAHDLRTPLTALMAQVEAMLSGVLPTDPLRLATLHTDLARLHRLVEDVLVLASAAVGKIPPLQLRPIVPGDLAERVVARFVPLADARDMRISLHVEAIEPILFDPDRMDTVLGTLVHNALIYGAPGTCVDVGVRRETGGGVLWRVHNAGPPIAKALLEHLGEPFVREDSARGRDGGSGLGLAMAAFWMRAHGGALTLVSGADGTVATASLP